MKRAGQLVFLGAYCCARQPDAAQQVCPVHGRVPGWQIMAAHGLGHEYDLGRDGVVADLTAMAATVRGRS